NPPAGGAAGSSQNGLKAGGADNGTTERGDTPGFRRDGETGYQSGSFDEWLDSFRDGQRLADVRDALRPIVEPALAAGVPAAAFTSRVREAVAKGVAPEVVVQALRDDAERWMWLASLTQGRSWPPAASSSGLYLAVAAAFRNGEDSASMRAVVEWGASTRASAEKTAAALMTAATVRASFGVASGEPGHAGDSGVALVLARSRLRVGQYSEVAKLAAKAAEAGIGMDRFLAALEATIGRGGRIADLERTLFG
ncbi:MAG: hypothetical protein JXM71_08600, partial [Spirochaetales bacterium]|nr:hypothetical protein [Spirochaetales bacterium]